MSNSDKLKDYIEQWKFDLVTPEDLDFLTEVADELEEIESLRKQVKELTDTIVECGFDRAKTEIESLREQIRLLRKGLK